MYGLAPHLFCCYLGIPLLLPGSPCLYGEADLGGAFPFLSFLGAIFLHIQVSRLGLVVGLHVYLGARRAVECLEVLAKRGCVDLC